MLEFTRRYPEHVITLVLACCRLGGGITPSGAFAPLFRLVYSADLLLWMFKNAMPTAYSRMMGIPKGYQPSPHEAEEIAAHAAICCFRSSPARRRRLRRVRVEEPAADRFPLEQLNVPTLVISARDDPLAPYSCTGASCRPRSGSET